MATFGQEIARYCRKHLVDEEPHPLVSSLSHQVGTASREVAGAFGGPVISLDLGVNGGAVGGSKVDRRPDVPGMQIELFGQRGHAIFWAPVGVP